MPKRQQPMDISSQLARLIPNDGSSRRAARLIFGPVCTLYVDSRYGNDQATERRRAVTQ